jgi:putative aldouronate transport system permease protein
MRKNSYSLGEITFNIFNYLFMCIMIIMMLYPMLYVLCASFSEPGRLMVHRGILLKPLGFTTGAYKLVFKNPMISSAYVNTLIYVISGTSISIVMTILFAFVISRKNLYWRDIIMVFVTFTMLFSGGMIPSYLVVKELHLINTRWALIIPGAINTYNLIIMRTSFLGIPDSLEESAKIDGANDFIVLLKIIIPVSMPVIAVMLLFYGVSNWNAWFDASIYLRKRELFPLQLVVREILVESKTEEMMIELDSGERGNNYSELIKYAVVIISTVPILCIYPFLQKYFVKGVMIGAIKG